MDNLNLEYTMISGLMKLAIEPILEQQKLNSKLIQLEYKQRLDLETLKQGKQLDFLYRVKFQEISHKFRMEANQNDFELKIKKKNGMILVKILGHLNLRLLTLM